MSTPSNITDEVSSGLGEDISIGDQLNYHPQDGNAQAEASNTDEQNKMPKMASLSTDEKTENTESGLDGILTKEQKINVNTLIRTKLPQELKLDILEQFALRWATRMPTEHFLRDYKLYDIRKWPSMLCDDWSGFKDSHFPPTNRATLINLPSHGWCAFPQYSDHRSPRIRGWLSAQHHSRNSFQLRTSFEKWISAASAQSYWEPARIENVFMPFLGSEYYLRVMKRFFFRHITWEFARLDEFRATTSNLNSRFDSTILGHIKFICLRIDGSWDKFTELFEHVIQAMTRENAIFPNLVALEILGIDFDAKKGKDFDRGGYTVIDAKIRVKYMVTRCYQLVKKRPEITIVLSGFSNNAITKLDPAVYTPLNGHRIRDKGFEYSHKQEEQFMNAENTLRGPHLEIPNEIFDYGYFDSSPRGPWRKLYHWKILFAEEWVKIWEQGLKESGSGASDDNKYYDAVYDPKRTIWSTGDWQPGVGGYESDQERDDWYPHYDERIFGNPREAGDDWSQWAPVSET